MKDHVNLPYWALGLPPNLATVLERLGYRNGQDVRTDIIDGILHWKSTRGIGRRSYLRICDWVGHQPTIREFERPRPKAVLEAINMLRRYGFTVEPPESSPVMETGSWRMFTT